MAAAGGDVPVGPGGERTVKELNPDLLSESQPADPVGDLAAEDVYQGNLRLNPMELKQCERLFATFDADGSGTIDHAELKEAMSCMGAILDDDEITSLLRNIDLDQSGTIDLDEFILFVILYKETCRLQMLHMPITFRSQLDIAWESAYLFPDSAHMWIMQITIVVCALYYFTVVSYYDAIQTTLPAGVVAANGVISIVYLADVVRCYFTLDPSRHQVTTQLSPEHLMESRKAYLKSWFPVDLLAALPFDVLAYFIADAVGGDTMAVLYLAHLRLLKLVKVNFLFGRSKRPALTRWYVRYNFYYVPLILRLFWWLVIVHFLACCWLMISPEDTYSTASYWVLYSVTTVGYGDIPIDTDGKRILAIVLCIGGMLGNGLLVGMLTLEMEKISSQNETDNIMVETQSLLQHLKIPRGLQEQIFAFQHHQLTHSLTAGALGVVDTLPPTIQENVELFLKCKFLSGVDFFDEVPEDCRLTIAACFTQMVHPPGDIILPEGAQLQDVHFITHGIVEMVAKGVRAHLLQRGDMFGVNALVGGVVADQTARSLTYVEVFVLNRADILCAMKIYPEFKDLVARRLRPDGAAPGSRATTPRTSPATSAPTTPVQMLVHAGANANGSTDGPAGVGKGANPREGAGGSGDGSPRSQDGGDGGGGDAADDPTGAPDAPADAGSGAGSTPQSVLLPPPAPGGSLLRNASNVASAGHARGGSGAGYDSDGSSRRTSLPVSAASSPHVPHVRKNYFARHPPLPAARRDGTPPTQPQVFDTDPLAMLPRGGADDTSRRLPRRLLTKRVRRVVARAYRKALQVEFEAFKEKLLPVLVQPHGTRRASIVG